MKKVSIIIPVYNVELYIEECIETLIKQNYSNLEIILIDDGSTDASGKICDEYAKKDKRIKVIHQINGGAANAKNAGLDCISGEYFTFIDSDDYVGPNWISDLVNLMETRDVDIVECSFCKEYKNKKEYIEKKINGKYTVQEYMKGYLNDWTSSLFWNKLFKSKLLNDIRFHMERRCIDDEFFTYKLICNAESIFITSNSYYHYRQRRSSAVMSPKNQLQITKDALDILPERYSWVISRYPSLKRIYLKHDIEILSYFANEFVFTEETEHKLVDMVLFYMKKTSIRELYLWKIMIKILVIQKKKVKKVAEQKNMININDLFE